MTQQEALVPVRMDVAEAEKYGHAFTKGRACMVKDLPLDAVPFRLAAIVMAGAELGFAPFTSIAGISIVEGKPRLSYQLMGTLVRRSGKYDYRAVEISPEKASVEFFELDLNLASPEKWRSLGTSTFTIEDAARADLVKKDVWKKYPKNMLFARALTQGVNFFCPDVAMGCPVYSEEDDLGDGERVVEGRRASAAVAVAAQVQPTPKEKPPAAPNPALTTAKEITAAATAAGAPVSETLETATVPAPATDFKILRPDGSTVPLDHASAAIENAKQDDAKAAAEKPARRPRAKKEATAASTVAGDGKAGSQPSSTIAPPPATASSPAPAPPPTAVAAAIPENPKVDVGHASPAETAKAEEKLTATAAAMGVTPENAPAALTPEPTKAQEKPAAEHPGSAAFNLANEFAALGLAAEKPVDGKLAARAHVCGVNFYGSDAAARAAWQTVGYALPKKGDKVSSYPTAKQLDGYLATIVQKAEEKESTELSLEPFTGWDK